MKKYLSLLLVALFICGQSVHARSKEVNDCINKQIELIIAETLGNAPSYVATKAQILQNGQSDPVSAKKMYVSWYIEQNTPNFRADRRDWKSKEIEELENFFRNEFPSRFEWIDRVATLYANQSISLTQDDKVRIEKLLRDLLLDSSMVEIPGYLFMGETGEDGNSIYWSVSNFSHNGEEDFSSPAQIHPAKFTCSIEGNDYSFSPRLPSVNEVKKLTRTSTPSLHITHERSRYLNEVNDDKIYVSNETNVLEFPTGAYWTSSPEWSYEFKVSGLDINTGDFPIEAKMVNVEQYNFDREYHGKSPISPMARLVISVDYRLIEAARSRKWKEKEEELNNILNGYEDWGASVSAENRNQFQPLVDFFNSIPQQVMNAHPFDYTLYKNTLISRDHHNQIHERPGSEFYTLEITLNSNGQKLAAELSNKFVELERTVGDAVFIKFYLGDKVEALSQNSKSRYNLPDGISELVQSITNCEKEIQKIALDFEIGINNPWGKETIEPNKQRCVINNTNYYYGVRVLPEYTIEAKQVFSLSFPHLDDKLFFENPFIRPLKKEARVFLLAFKPKSSADNVYLIFNDKKVKVKYKNRYYRTENGEVIFE